jgi:hypothetical protein
MYFHLFTSSGMMKFFCLFDCACTLAVAGVAVSQELDVTIELVKKSYVIVSIPEYSNQVAFASVTSFNSPKINTHELFQIGAEAKVKKNHVFIVCCVCFIFTTLVAMVPLLINSNYTYFN